MSGQVQIKVVAGAVRNQYYVNITGGDDRQLTAWSEAVSNLGGIEWANATDRSYRTYLLQLHKRSNLYNSDPDDVCAALTSRPQEAYARL